MSLPTAADGCILPNIATHRYTVTLEAPCEHTKVREVVVTLNAPSADDAVRFVKTWCMLGALRSCARSGADVTEAAS